MKLFALFALFAATLLMAFPASAEFPLEFRVKNCDAKWVRVCAYDHTDKSLDAPYVRGNVKVKSGEGKAVACFQTGNAEKCRVFWREKKDGCGKPTMKKVVSFAANQTYYVWFDGKKRRFSKTEPANCGSL